jgi:threonylcarbamoyladenosine tRNA methylthiotransferase MtaB
VRAGTTAAKLEGRVAPGEIKRRSALMRDLGETKRERFARRFIGNKLKVLLEEPAADGRMRGYSRNYLRVLTDGNIELSNCEVEVEASIAEGAQLVGQIIRTDAPPSGATVYNAA